MQLVDAQALLGADRDQRGVAAVVLDDHAVLGELGLDPVRVGVGLVDLVERDDDRHLRRAGVVDGLEGLGHDAVVGGDDEDRDVGHPGAAGTHGRERLVARRVEEDDALAVLDDLAGADVLGDAAALAGRDLGRPDGVEQARLAVVDVAHDGHDRRPRLEQRRVVLLEEDLLGGLGDRRLGAGLATDRWRHRLGDLVAQLARHQRRRVAIDELVDAGEDAALDQLADDVRGVDREQVGQLLDGDGAGDLDRAALRRIDGRDATGATLHGGAGRLAGPTPIARAASATSHGCLLRWSGGRRRRAGSRRSGGRDVSSARSRLCFLRATDQQAPSAQR